MGGRATRRAATRSRCTRRRVSSRTSPPISPSRSARAPRRQSWLTCSASTRQECALDPRSDHATVGGMLATGLSGYRRLRHGPLRDRVLEVRFVNADGDIVKGGGPTVKNVSGFDIPRLVVGSLGTHRRAHAGDAPVPTRRPASEWSTTDRGPARGAAARLPAVVRAVGRAGVTRPRGRRRRRRGRRAGRDGDDRWKRGARVPERLAPGSDLGPAVGADRARARARPRAGALAAPKSVSGTVHVAADAEADAACRARGRRSRRRLVAARGGCAGLDGFGAAFPNLALHERIRAAFDPTGKFSRARAR